MQYSGNPVYIVMSSIEGGGGGGEDIHVIIKMLPSLLFPLFATCTANLDMFTKD